jgi:hypothetical protein
MAHVSVATMPLSLLLLLLPSYSFCCLYISSVAGVPANAGFLAITGVPVLVAIVEDSPAVCKCAKVAWVFTIAGVPGASVNCFSCCHTVGSVPYFCWCTNFTGIPAFAGMITVANMKFSLLASLPWLALLLLMWFPIVAVLSFLLLMASLLCCWRLCRLLVSLLLLASMLVWLYYCCCVCDVSWHPSWCLFSCFQFHSWNCWTRSCWCPSCLSNISLFLGNVLS